MAMLNVPVSNIELASFLRLAEPAAARGWMAAQAGGEEGEY